jgi:inner membrane protein
MPSPVGHSLIGLAVSIGFLAPRGRPGEILRGLAARKYPLLLGVVVANAPDIDYLPGIFMGDINRFHHAITHTPGWIALAAAGGWMIWRALRPAAGWREFLFLLSLLASHLAADWLTLDTRPPIGIMALWPFSAQWFQSPVTLFWDLRKNVWADFIQAHNFLAVLVEAAWCLPLTALAFYAKCRRRAGGPRSGPPAMPIA